MSRDKSSAAARGVYPATEYERMFNTLRRPKGRPTGSGQDRFVFSMRGKNRDLAKIARQRAVAVIMETNRDRLRKLFESEYKVLEARLERMARAEGGADASEEGFDPLAGS